MTTNIEEILLLDNFSELKKLFKTKDIPYLSACVSSAYFIFSYINTSSVTVDKLKEYHENIHKCLNYIRTNNEIYIGFNILTYYFCTLITNKTQQNFSHGNNNFNVDAFNCYLKFKFTEMYPREYTKIIKQKDFNTLYKKVSETPVLMYNYFSKELYDNLNTKIFLSICYASLIIFFSIVSETSQYDFIKYVKENKYLKR